MKFESVLQKLTDSASDIANAKAKVENNEIFHCLYDAVIDSHSTIVEVCKNTQDLRDVIKDAISYAVAKKQHSESDKCIIIDKNNNRYVFISMTVSNNRPAMICFNKITSTSETIYCDNIKTIIAHGTEHSVF